MPQREDMNKIIDTIYNIRKSLLSLIEDLSIEQLNEIPPGFTNNIIWNLAHITAGTQKIFYVRAGLHGPFDEPFVEKYQRGTKPETKVDAQEVAYIKEMLLSSILSFAKEYEKGNFNYIPWKTIYNVEINTMEDAINFVPFHDGLHYGYIMALKRFVAI